MLYPIYMDGSAKSAFEICQSGGVDVQIDPHPVGSNFEFLVAALKGRFWLKKCFGHVTVPKVVTAAVEVRVVEHEKIAVFAHEPEI